MCIQTVYLKAVFPGISECSSTCTVGEGWWTILTVLPSQPLLVFVPNYLPTTLLSGAICRISCTFLWSCLLILGGEYLLQNNMYSMYYYEKILKYFNCGPWMLTQFSHSIHIPAVANSSVVCCLWNMPLRKLGLVTRLLYTPRIQTFQWFRTFIYMSHNNTHSHVV